MRSRWWNKFSILTAGFLLLGCAGKPAWEYMPDMADSPAPKAYEYDKNLPHHRSAFLPAEGTIPRNYQPYPYKKEEGESAGVGLRNPLPKTEDVVLAGQKTYNTYCAVCHGAKGLGDGPVIPKFPKPPSLQSDKIRDWSDGRLYHVITTGQNLMPSYASQIDPNARWAAVHYIRALQKADKPLPEDVEAYRKEREAKKKK